ncbi:hypothetical protein IC619_016475 [Hazenella sp. IB182353]|uniref:hypothetical protein n=1 Tax=Polycladospora coralii TaxID=2771432 RepID=UPI0017461254|nr:hypothetical protein [Polycladospora coralii]MBS7532038.1 hypothetical protein [Polycladospora coralii]
MHVIAMQNNSRFIIDLDIDFNIPGIAVGFKRRSNGIRPGGATRIPIPDQAINVSVRVEQQTAIPTEEYVLFQQRFSLFHQVLKQGIFFVVKNPTPKSGTKFASVFWIIR